MNGSRSPLSVCSLHEEGNRRGVHSDASHATENRVPLESSLGSLLENRGFRACVARLCKEGAPDKNYCIEQTSIPE